MTTKDVHLSVEEGFASLELSKRYTTVTMGPCQGTMCHRNSGLVMARELGVDPDEQRVGVTTARPPHNPTSFSLLAGRGYEPVKRTSVHHWHADRGGKMLWAGDWKRPYDYGTPDAETAAVHESLGLIDVSTLGKLIVRGPDAAAFLERVYPNRYGDMKLARVRYGIVCGDDGSILDDGTVARLSETEFYVTTTSSGAGGMEQWFTWWNAVWGMDCQIVNVTSAIAAFNLAGPNARTALAGLTGFDLANEAFPYLGAGHAEVAGRALPAPADRLRGRARLRDPLPGGRRRAPVGGADGGGRAVLGAAVRARAPARAAPREDARDRRPGHERRVAAARGRHALDREARQGDDWIGRYSIEWYQGRGNRASLVGFEGMNGAVPKEGAQVVGDGEPVGRVTSSRFSRRLGKAIGIAWVPADLAAEGTAIALSDPSGATIPASVTREAFYDPDQERLRS